MKKVVFLLGAVLTLFSGCSKEEDKLITLLSSEKTLYYGDEYQIEATSNTPILYSSEDEFHANVSESGLVTAMFVGETHIVLSNGKDTKKVLITVKAKSNLYPEPYLEFGISRSSFITKYGTPDSETEDGLLYEDYSNASPAIMYLFDENNKLESVGVLVKTAYSSNLGTFLGERYLLVDEEDLIFINALKISDATMAVSPTLYNISYWIVIYMPSPSTTKSSLIKRHISIHDFDKLFNLLK